MTGLQWNWWDCHTPNAVPLLDVLRGAPEAIQHLIAKPHFGFVERQAQFLYICLVSAIAFGVLRIFTKTLVFPHIAWLCGVSRSPTKVNKFSYQLWLITYYGATSSFSVWILRKYPWWGAPVKCDANHFLWVNHPLEIPDELFRWYYLLQAGFYVEELIATCLETKRADFWEYIIHHVVTLGLVVGSFMSLDMRVGSLVFLYHDIPDIFLCAAKLFNYAKRELPCNLCFVGFVLSFAFFRLYLFPGLILSSWTVGLTTRPLSISSWALSCFMAFGLIPLHLYWLFLILRMLVRILFVDRTVQGDIRSDDEDEADADTRNKNKKKKLQQQQQGKESGGASNGHHHPTATPTHHDKRESSGGRRDTNGHPPQPSTGTLPSPKAKQAGKGKRASKDE